jgi:hypothetical protein
MLAAPRFGRGQAPSKIPRIGILWFGSMDTPAALQDRSAFRGRLAALGYVEGRNIVIEERSAAGNPERLRELEFRRLLNGKVGGLGALQDSVDKSAWASVIT